MVVVAAVIALLIMVNALYVAAEFAAVSVRQSRIRQHAEEGDVLARMLLPILSDGARLDRYIAACQIGITLSSLVLGAYGQAALAPRLSPIFERFGGLQEVAAQSASAAVILVALTVFQMVLGELVPKSLALQYPTAVARYTVVPMRWSLSLLSWFIVLLNGSGLAILRLFGVRDAPHRHIHSPGEIEYLIAESREGGYLEPDEHRRLRHALRLAGRQVGEVMVPRTRVQGIPIDSSPAALLRIVTDTPFTRFPAYEGSLDHIVGIVHVEDVAVRQLAREEAPPVASLVRPFIAVQESLSLERALARLRDERQHLAVVVDDFGGTAGLVTIGDILDEIFGGIADEFKTAPPEAQPLPDGRIRIPGRMSLTESDRWTGVAWTGDAYTVGGLVIEQIGRFPEPGETLEIDGVTVEVERVRGHAVESLIVTPARRREDRRG
jgi:CBS domain containing-hemolysin-like protein